MNAWGPGTRLGPYELVGHLGAGGMGEVWKARDTRVDRVVAIKRLKTGHTERFTREARAIAALNHPRICQLYDVGPDYLVMEYIEGEIPRGPVPVTDALRLALQIAEALTAAHITRPTPAVLNNCSFPREFDSTEMGLFEPP